MENNVVGFSTNSCNIPTNKNLQVTFVPKTDTVNYNYTIYKDDNVLRTVTIDSNRDTTIYLDTSGKYRIEVNEVMLDGTSIKETSCEYIVDKEKPILTVGEESLTLIQGGEIDIMGGVTATDNIDGNLNSFIITNEKELNFEKIGKKQLTYTVSDRAGNTVTKNVYVNVVEDPLGLLIFQSVIIIFLMFALAYIIRYRRSLKLEKRVEKFSINPLIDTRPSIFDEIIRFFNKIANSIKPTFEKSVFITKYSKRYEKYVGTIGFNTKDGIDFVAIKFLTGVSLLLVAAFSKAIQLKMLATYEIWMPLLIGFFLPDLLFFSKYKFYRKQLENDLLQAIVIMNNAFKSGRSITQAISLVTKELKGPIAIEFKKMHMEINLGLGIEEVFERFSKRMNLEEITYMTASLSIINKTGGNIIRVFDSIEKTLVGKKKLRLEMNSLTGGSKIIVNVLFFVPLMFVLFVSVINPSYFIPLFTNPFGIMLLVFMILYYIIYIICVKWIMKVRM